MCILIVYDWFVKNCKIHLSLWMRQSFIKINDKTCESLCTVNYY